MVQTEHSSRLYMATTTTNAWYSWTSSATATTTTYMDDIWGAWASTATSATTSYATDTAWSAWLRPYQLRNSDRIEVASETPEQRQHREAQARRYADEQKQRDLERKAAENKAEELFRDIFGEIAFKRFKDKGFHEMVGHSGTLYRMRPGQQIEVVKNGKVDHRLCVVHPYDSGLPLMDTLVTQALLVGSGKEGEDELLKVGIKHAA